MTENEWLTKFQRSSLDLEELADTAVNVKPNNGLALRAINYLNTLEEFRGYLDGLGYEEG